MKTWIKLLPLVLSALSLHAATTTYYIDWDGGSDANNGLTTSTAWKRAPRMKGYAGSHPVPVAGDRFIFKGGVTWPHDALKLYITNSGTAANPIYYGIDSNYYTGASWTRPVFDCASTIITDSLGTPQVNQNAAAILIQARSGSGSRACNITIEGLWIKNHRGITNGTGTSAGSSSICLHPNSLGINAITNILLKNLVISDWSLSSYANAKDSGDHGGITCREGVPQHVTIEDCEFYLSNPAAHSGTAVKNFQAPSNFRFRRNRMHDLSGGMVTVGGIIQSNFFYNIAINGEGQADDLSHENIIYDIGRGSTITYNYWSNNVPPCWYQGPGSASASTTPFNTNTGFAVTLIANNLMFRNPVANGGWFGTRCALNIDNETLAGSGGTSNGWINSAIRVVNNTVYCGDGPFILFSNARQASYPNNKLGRLEIGNNHIITNTIAPFSIWAGGLVIPEIYFSNLIHSVSAASAMGMTTANGFKPQSADTPLYGNAVDFRYIWPNLVDSFNGTSRLLVPDIGGWEFDPGGGSPLQPPDINKLVVGTGHAP